ncbi:type II toxin-antitoxin system VapC family toxin [Leptospirillum ferriphilum]|jgi:predicted nucleic acid-binding protein|uniref:type II toxin-antitoxin system VapC family toxin n=1 Tax=Leptospirillum ferriphilum TaxID=178606 RepID=UPI003EE6D6A5
MPFVLDCSITMTWIFPDESTDSSEALRESLLDDFAIVPTLWFFEVGNFLKSALRRGRIGEEEWFGLAEALQALPIEMDSESHHLVWESLLPIALRLDLSVYDAAYLELALRHELPLATLDRDLRFKAKTLGVKVIG